MTPARVGIMTSQFTKLLACLDAEFDTPIPKHLARLALMDFCIHVERGEEGIER